jgi:AraC family transcriptional regulator
MNSTSLPFRVSNLGQHNVWTQLPGADRGTAGDGILVSRFLNSDSATREVQLETGANHYRISITLRSAEVSAHYNGRAVYDGKTETGMVQIAEPNTRISGLLRSPGEALHLFVPGRFVGQLGEEGGTSGLCLRKTIFEFDHPSGFLGRAIADSMLTDDLGDRLYVDSLCMAVVARLLNRFSNAEPKVSRRPHGLSGWRLKRVREFVDAHLERPISLQELADAAGLSRMHFASQFCQACGIRPHEYLLQQRIERSKEMLLHSRLPVVQIASAVGFATQSHYSTIFKRMVGETPTEWRRLRIQS